MAVSARDVLLAPVRLALAGFVRAYGAVLFWRFLDGVYVQGLAQARAVAAEGPVILACNHTCWWDGILAIKLHHWLGVDGRFFVATEGAATTAVIPSMGGIPIDRTSVGAMAEVMERTAGWLDRPGRSLLLFPQGRFRHPSIRPLALQRGVRLLHKLSGATVIPVAISFGYLDTHLPACVITLGQPMGPRRDLVEALDQALTEALDAHVAWFDDPVRPKPTSAPFAVQVSSGVIPIERRPGSWLFTAVARAVGAVARAVRGALGP